MRLRGLLVWIVGALFLNGIVASADDKTSNDEHVKKLVGKWMRVSGVRDGEALKPSTYANMAFKIMGGKLKYFLYKKSGEESIPSDVKIDPSKSPAQIDIIDDSPDKSIAKGIYKLEGDTLTVFIAEYGKGKRPEKFESKPGKGTELYVYKRAK
jgi:uncharacterized protein (TIGR03067 family)